jgi:exodeoxyribonuclease III
VRSPLVLSLIPAMSKTQRDLGVLTLNVCSPSQARAERQLEWLSKRPEQVFVLTEMSDGVGSTLLVERLRSAGWNVQCREPQGGERGVLIASRVALGREVPAIVSYLPERVAAISIGTLEIIGVYAPSRDDSAEKVARKRRFLAELLTVVGARPASDTVLIGDLNIVERGQRSGDGTFREWEYELYEELPSLSWMDAYRVLHPDRVEYSWVGVDGVGHRFDHTFITGDLTDRLLRCEYVHETRETDLSDHSALHLELSGVEAAPIEVDESLSGEQPTLF